MAESQEQAPMDVLVIDDVPQNLVAVEAALQGLRMNLTLATSGEEGLRYLLERDFALILLDVQMPNMDGLETAKMIRQRKRSRHVPIIFVTAFDSNDDDVLAAYRLGAVDFLFKPLHADILRAKVSVFIELERRTLEVEHQARLLRDHEETTRQRALADQRRRLEADALRKSLAEEKRHTEELAKKNEELEHIRAQLLESNTRLERHDRRKDEFIAVLAHELRNPLAAVMAGVDVLRGEADREKLDNAVQVMDRQCDHLIRLVDDLLDVSRIGSGKLRLRRRAVTAAEFIDDATKLAAPSIAEKSHSLTVDNQAPDAIIFGDPIRLSQMVANLLSNAARYTPDNGVIELVVLRNDDAEVEVRVSDNGCGIAPEMLGRVFDMFVQETSSTGGLGIGLTLVQNLAALHQGRVTAHSDGVGKGSQFVLYLPLSSRPSHAILPPDSDPPLSNTRLRIALVDDYEDIRVLTRTVLERSGHSVFEAATGQDGVDLILRELPDVAIIDIGLPDIEGYEVAATLRSKLSANDCPRLIAMTGYGQEKDKARAKEAGFDAHLRKPATAAAIRAAIDKVRS